MKGSYILVIKLPEEQKITVGRLQAINFPRGYYAYVGSALSGLESRLRRHLQQNKKLHWHIDYLIQKASINNIIIFETKERIECNIARSLSRKFDSIPGFGSSDCKCPSHLFFTKENMTQEIISTLELSGIKSTLIEDVNREKAYMQF